MDKLYEIADIDMVPEVPGIYAWYAVPIAGPLDWGERPDELGVDQGGKVFSQFLAAHTRTLHHPEVKVAVEWHFWTEWNGTLLESGTEALATAIELVGSQPESNSLASMRKVLASAPDREKLATILLGASPWLSAPIYIGIATNLRDRLDTHAKNLEEASDLIRSGQDPEEEMKNCFGLRAAVANLSPDSLRVGIRPLPPLAEFDTDRQKTLALAAEYVLNRWHHPIFGRV